VHPPEVLPVWVAEMDVPLAGAIVAALRETAERVTPATPMGPLRGGARRLRGGRWGWRFEVASSTNVPDVMRGMVAVMDLLTGPGDASL